MNIERPGSPSATTVAPTSKRRSTSIDTRRSRLASERPPKKGVATKNAFRSDELTTINLIYSRSRNLTAPRAPDAMLAVGTSTMVLGLEVPSTQLFGPKPRFAAPRYVRRAQHLGPDATPCKEGKDPLQCPKAM